jgi:succinate dehydrogenase flavin-adding protein (antitoxin of CptAB toxin-antitoxin module)
MAESLAEYVDVVKERIATVKKTLESLQRPSYYKETFEAFAPAVMEDVPTDVAENWIDQLTIRQFNEELSDVFPYIYKLVSEASKAEELTAEDLMAEVAGPDKCWPGHRKVGTQKGTGKNAGKRVNKCKKIESEEMEIESAFEEMMGQFAEQETNETQEGKVGTMALFVTDQDGGEHEVEVEVEIKNGKPEIVANTLPGPEDRLYWDDADIEQQAMDAMKNGDIEFDESFDPQSEPSERDLAVEDMMNAYEKGGEKALAAYMHISEEELDQDINEWCAEHGKHPDDDRDEAIEGVVEELADMTEFDSPADFAADVAADNAAEGNAYAHAVKKAKMNGKKKGDKVDGPDGDEITLEKDEKTPLGEFILSYFDRENGSFPKGETAVLTMIEKDYGEEYITPAKQFIERINQTFEEYQMREQPQQMENPEFERIRELAGLR